jgi:OOP family OmpA-OmpF porin
MRSGSKILLGAAVAAAVLAAPMAAHAQDAQPQKKKLELGGFVGWHLFNQNNELGVPDAPDSQGPDDGPGLGVRMGFLFGPRFAVEGELVVIPTASNGVDVTVFGWRVHALVHLVTAGKWRPFVLVGAGAMSLSSSDSTKVESDTDLQAHAGVGVKYDVTDDWGLRLDVRGMLPPSSASAGPTVDGEVWFGLYGRFPMPEKKKEEAKTEAPPPADTDKDGLSDDVDHCPRDAEDKDGFADDDGCPDADNDGDGLPDGADKCPDQAEDKDGFADDDGCPDADNDDDGVPDVKDRCPLDAEDKDGTLDDDGCPDLDDDADGVPDAKDQCKGQPETMNGYKDDDGCPDELPAEVKKFTGAIQGINFDNGKSTITKPSFPVLDKAVAVMQQYPDLRIEISGHTDDNGTHDDNMKLSKDRAEAVKTYLVEKGVNAARIETVGYGPDKPVADNKTPAGKAKNRRIEFRLLSPGEK